MSVAQDLRFRCGHFLQGRQGFFGAAFLHNAQDGVEHHDGHDGGRVHPLTQQGGDDGGHDQQDDHKIVKLVPQLGEERGALFGQLVQAVLRRACAGLPRG